MPGKLQGRSAVVTGAGSGIGRAIAQSLSDEGASVVLVDIDGTKAEHAARDLRSRDNDVLPFQADVADPQSVHRLCAFVRDTFGPLAILVNNAAIQVNKLIEDTTPEE